MNIKKTACLFGAFVVFIFFFKACYFDTDLGYTLESLPYSTTGCPLFIEAIIAVLMMPLIAYSVLEELCDKIINIFNKKRKVN